MEINYRTLLKSQHLKATPIRLKLLEIMYKASRPVDVSFIRQKLNDVSPDEATVYRSLNDFVEKGLLRKIMITEGKIHFEISSLPHHHHAICMDCGKIEEITYCIIPKLEKDIIKNLDFKIKNHNMEFYGACSSCRK